jgi:CHAT domain-containing protein/tetratricopeptide (TPR) repeat protein
MLARYEFGASSVEERQAVEDHVSDCDACFAELERGSHAVAAMRAGAAGLAALLGTPAAPPAPRRRGLASPRPASHRLGWILAPAALVAVLGGIAVVHVLRAPDPATFATFPTEALAPEIQRAPGERDAVRELLEAGAAHFDLRQYDEAARRFRAASARDPARADAAYLAGLATVLAGDARAALPELERAVGLAQGELRRKTAWVLANAYLRAGRPNDARRVLAGLLSAGDEYGARARVLLKRLGRARSDAGEPRSSRRRGRPPVVRVASATEAASAGAALDAARRLFEAERWAAAGEQAQQAATAAAARGDTLLEIDARTLAADCAFYQGRLQPAGAEFATALDLAARRGDRRREARALEGSARVRSVRGDERGALPAFRTVLGTARICRDPLLECGALLGLGRCQSAIGERAAAVATFEEALATARRSALAVMEARALQDLSLARHRGGDQENAIALQEEALRLARRTGKKQEIVGASVRAGLLYVDAEQYSRGLASLREALPLAEDLGHRRALLNIRTQQASIYTALDRPEQALDELEAALVIARGMQAVRAEAGILRRKGHVLADLGRDDETARAFDDALRIMRTVGNPVDEIDLLHELGEFHLVRGRLAPASRFLRDAFAGFDSVQNAQLAGHVECLLGEVAARQGDLARARAHCAGAMARARTLGDHAVLRDALRLEAALCRDSGDLRGADLRLAEAIRVSETVCAGLAGAEHRVGFHATSRPLYAERVRVLYDIGAPAAHQEAFRVMEMARARVLLDALAGIRVEPGASIDPALGDRQTQCLRRLRALQIELSKAESEVAGATAPLDSLRRAHQDASRSLREIRQEIAARAPSYGTLLGVTPPLGAGEVRERVLVPDQVLLEYLVGADASYVCAIDADTLRLQRLAAGAPELEDLVVACRNAILGDDRVLIEATSRRLYDLLIAPIASALDPEARLLIVPDGVLFELPFAALHDGQRFLVERHAIATAPSASALDPRLRRRVAARPPRLLAVGNPASYREDALLANARALHGWSFGELPYAEDEARRIGRYFRRKKIVVGDDATEELVKAEIAEASVVHFATHGVVDAGEPLLCGLVLAQDDDPREDGLLQVHEILGMRLDADLVVLSACGSGLGRRVSGEGVLGLTRAFLHTGARRLLISLWEVGDRSTGALMEHFYAQRFESSLPTDLALRAAQLEFVAQSPPRDWAPFAVTGAVEPRSPAALSTRKSGR